MARMMNIPILSIVENMSYFECPNCNEKHYIYGESHIDDIASKYEIKSVIKIPMNQSLAQNCDKGLIELYEGDWMNGLAELLKGI